LEAKWRRSDYFLQETAELFKETKAKGFKNPQKCSRVNQLLRSHKPSAYRPIISALHRARLRTTKKRSLTFSAQITRFRLQLNESSIVRASAILNIKNGQVNKVSQIWGYSNYLSAEEISSFEVGLATKGKNFYKIREEFLPKKDVKDLVLQYYYVWFKFTVNKIISKNLSGRKARSTTLSLQKRGQSVTEIARTICRSLLTSWKQNDRGVMVLKMQMTPRMIFFNLYLYLQSLSGLQIQTEVQKPNLKTRLPVPKWWLFNSMAAQIPGAWAKTRKIVLRKIHMKI